MQLCSVENKLNTFFIKIRFSLSNVLITGESNFDEKNVEEVFNLTELYKYWNYLLQNWYFNWQYVIRALISQPWPAANTNSVHRWSIGLGSKRCYFHHVEVKVLAATAHNLARFSVSQRPRMDLNKKSY